MTEKSDQSEGEHASDEEKKIFQNSTDRDKTNTSVSQTSNFENSITHMPAKEINSELHSLCANIFSLTHFNNKK